MADLQKRISVEISNISLTLVEINNAKNIKEKTKLELAGLATFLHNFYNGIENILKQILQEKSITVVKTDLWHKALLEIAVENKVITPEFKISLSDYLAFRHFFVHGYGFMLDESRLASLANNANEIFNKFKENIQDHYSA